MDLTNGIGGSRLDSVGSGQGFVADLNGGGSSDDDNEHFGSMSGVEVNFLTLWVTATFSRTMCGVG